MSEEKIHPILFGFVVSFCGAPSGVVVTRDGYAYLQTDEKNYRCYNAFAEVLNYLFEARDNNKIDFKVGYFGDRESKQLGGPTMWIGIPIDNNLNQPLVIPDIIVNIAIQINKKLGISVQWPHSIPKEEQEKEEAQLRWLLNDQWLLDDQWIGEVVPPEH